MHTAAVRRLTGDEHLDAEFATTWSQYDLDEPTRALLQYAVTLTEAPMMVDKSAVDALRDAGWDEQAIWEITALVSYFNFTGRLAAASDLPPDEIPVGAPFKEASES
jgi:uncharacterized peroxidase-related enzyme